MDWQPIETAPMDGTFILICSPEGHVGVGFMVARDLDGDPYVSESAAWIGRRRFESNPSVWMGGCRATEATHWMPLPEAPKP